MGSIGSKPRSADAPARMVLTGAIVLAVAAVCVRLGLWQIERLHDRRQRNASIAARLGEGVASLSPTANPDSLDFRRARVSGVWDFGRQAIVVGRPMQGVPGVHIVTPLQLVEGGTILVERGWVPSPDARAVDLSAFAEEARAAVEGVLHAVGGGGGSPNVGAEWPIFVRSADPESLASRFPYPVFPLVLRRTEAPASGLPPPMRLVPLPELTDGPHLSYALQWFGFAVIAVVGGIALGRRQSRDLRTPADHQEY